MGSSSTTGRRIWCDISLVTRLGVTHHIAQTIPWMSGAGCHRVLGSCVCWRASGNTQYLRTLFRLLRARASESGAADVDYRPPFLHPARHSVTRRAHPSPCLFGPSRISPLDPARGSNRLDTLIRMRAVLRECASNHQRQSVPSESGLGRHSSCRFCRQDWG